MRTMVLIALTPLLLPAQDAEMVLRTSVGYNTQLRALSLTEEQKKEATRLGQEAQRVGFSGQYGQALKLFYQGMAVMQGTAWTPEVEVAASLECKADHALVNAGQKVTIGCRPLYVSEREAEAKLSAQVSLRGLGEASPPVTLDASTWKAIPFTVPEGASGRHTIDAQLTKQGEEPNAKARAAFLKAIPIVISPVVADAAKLRDRVRDLKLKEHAIDPTVEYALELVDRADRGEVNPHRIDLARELATANAILDNPSYFAGKPGDFHRAYRSEVDQTLQPYRLFVPSTYDGEKAAPLVIALHGMGGDENQMFDSYPNQVVTREAERLGFLVAAPKGRGAASMYRGTAEKDVLDVLAEVMKDYKVDEDRIYLMGHSMGGYGTWSIAANHPDKFAALGPIAGGGNPASMTKIKHIPHYVVHGDADNTVPVTQSRNMVEAGKKLGMNIVYVEVPGGNHTAIAAPNFAPMFDFFAKHSRSASTASGSK